MSEEVRDTLNEKLNQYPRIAFEHQHQIQTILPLKVANILKEDPQLISLAVDAFYKRDVQENVSFKLKVLS